MNKSAFAKPPDVDRAAAMLAAAPLNVIVFAFTSSSYLLGADADAFLKTRLEENTGGIPVVIQCAAAVAALRAVGAQRPALVHPPWWPDVLDEWGVAYFRDQGFDDRAIHDAVQVVALFNYYNRLADGLGVRWVDEPNEESSS